MFSLLTATLSAYSRLDHGCFKMFLPCTEDICKCYCEYKHRASCQNGNVLLHLDPQSSQFSVECQTPHNEFNHVPEMDLGDFRFVGIDGCTISQSPPLSEILQKFRIRSLLKQSSLEVLTLRSSQLTRLDKEYFRKLSVVQDLRVWDCKIQEIHEDALLPLRNLAHLDLYNSSIQSLPLKLLRTNSKLKRVMFNNNNIPRLPKDLFANLPALNEIYFRRSGTVFANSSSINTIWLSENRIRGFAPLTFHGLESLAYLELQSNRIAELPRGLLSSCHMLSYLDLSDNLIETLDV